MNSLGRAFVAVALAVLVVAVAGCGGGDGKLKGKQMRNIETGIKQKIEAQNRGTRVLSVTCPDSVKKKKGVVFTCHVKGSRPGQEADATVTETKDNGSVHFVVP